MRKLLFIAILFCLKQVKAQTYVTVPDANFSNYLQVLIPAAMNGNQMDITNPLVTTSTQTLNVSNKSIANLSGIQYFTSLTFLNCSLNVLTTLSTLPNSLTYLDCGFNYTHLTTLPALPNSLQTLYCSHNSLTTLPTLPNSLIYLSCFSNNITTLPALPNSITDLECQGNYLTTLPALPTSLQQLWCNYNSLTTLPTLPNSLNVLYCNNNNITCFPPFPNSIGSGNLSIDPNSYNCFPNHILAMNSTQLAVPLCAAGNSNGCPNATAGIESVTDNNNHLSIYPNPTSDQFFIDANTTDKLNVDLYDVNGRHVFGASVSDKSNINVTTLTEGIYSLTIKTADCVINKKLVILR